MEKTIAYIFNRMRKQRTTIMSSQRVNSIKSILMDPKKSKYLHQIVALYHYSAFNQDRKNFLQLDNILYSSHFIRQNSIIHTPPLSLAYLRLHCLLKYQQPYEAWIPVVKEAMHQASPLSSTEIRTMISLTYFSFVRVNHKLLQLYSDYLTEFNNSLDDIDIISLMVLRKNMSSAKIRSQKFETMKQRIEQKLNERVFKFSTKQMQLLATSQVISQNWIFYFYLNLNLPDSQFGFFIDLLNRPSPWRVWAIDTFGRKNLINKITKSSSGDPKTLMQNLLVKIRIPRPFSDQFFQIEQFYDPELKVQRHRLKNIEEMKIYIENAYKVFATGGISFLKEQLLRVEQILYDIKQVRFQQQFVFLYISLYCSIIHYLYKNDLEIKKSKEAFLVRNAYDIFQKCLVQRDENSENDKQYQSGTKLIATRVLRPLATLEIETMKMNEFKQIYSYIRNVPDQFEQTIKLNIMSGQNLEILKVIDNFISDNKAKSPLILFGGYKKLAPPLQNPYSGVDLSVYEFYYATNIQFDRTLTVDCLLKIKDSKTGKEIKILLDLGFETSWVDHSNQIRKAMKMPEKYQERVEHGVNLTKEWKRKYIGDWYQYLYEAVQENSIEEFILSRKFQKYFLS